MVTNQVLFCLYRFLQGVSLLVRLTNKYCVRKYVDMPVNAADYSSLFISLVGRLSRNGGKMLESHLDKEGLTLQQFKIVGLMIGEEGISQKELASRLAVKPATLSVAINKLEEKALVLRRVCGEDRRVNLLYLSDDIDLIEINSLLFGMEESLSAGVSKKDLAVTKRVLAKMIANLEADTGLR
ncbi:MAG: MarR family transcriptional regulator [Gammaproteobacteria bacterium]|nr:MarR family transcriptional regulator [Gammaproteobacteria bacterium]